MHQFSRNAIVFGNKGLEILANTTVVVLGVGGVGSFAIEALARSGVGTIIIYDKDVVDITNINRQVHALTSTIGRSKCELMAERVKLINPNCKMIIHNTFVTSDNITTIFAQKPDYIIEAIDTISIKIEIIIQALKHEIPLISSMGMANKLDPTKITITDIWKTQNDPIARIIRKALRERRLGDQKVPVVFSNELPRKPQKSELSEIANHDSAIRKQQIPPASVAYVPSVAGLLAASFVINTTMEKNEIYKL